MANRKNDLIPGEHLIPQPLNRFESRTRSGGKLAPLEAVQKFLHQLKIGLHGRTLALMSEIGL